MDTISWKTAATLLILGGAATAGAAWLAPQALDRGPGEQAPPAIAPEPAAPAARLVAPEKSEGRSILANGGVEDGEKDSPQAWTMGASIPGVDYTWSRVGHKSKASLCLKKTAQRFFPIAQWSQKVDREGEAPRLKVSAWVKADQAAKAILDAQFVDGKGKWTHAWAAYIGAKEADDPPANHDWTRYEGVVAIPPGTKQVLIAPQIYGPGTVWFDDITAEYTDDPAIDPTGP